MVSIIVNNYNYGRFLEEAINSALAQTHTDTEVIIVDDGSTDGSREIIARYDGRVVTVLKENGGQASAFNAGFAASHGQVIIFLDSDDALLPSAAESAAQIFAEERPAKVHWPLWIIDEHSKRTGRSWPSGALPDGDLREITLRHGPSSSYSPPTSGNAWARSLLEELLPVPEEYRLCADDYLYALAPAFGPVKRLTEPQGFYRLHGRNNYLSKSFEEKLRFGYEAQNQQCSALERYLRNRGIRVDAKTWKTNLWFHRLTRAVQSLTTIVPIGEACILVDEDQWGTPEVLRDRRRFHFLERGGQYWGPPADDGAAIFELERLRQAGVGFLAFAWPAFWWLDYYGAFHQYLQSEFRCLLEDDDLILFDLRR